MRKKIFGLLLLLGLMLSILPVVSMANDEIWDGDIVAKYNELYVQDGLYIHLDAFDTDSSRINLETGEWLNQYDGWSYATLRAPTEMVGDIPLPTWSFGEHGGIKYDMNVEQWEVYKTQTGIDLAFEDMPLPSEDYTFQMVFAPLGFSEDGKRVYQNFNNWASVGNENMPSAWVDNKDRVAAFSLGPFKATAFGFSRPSARDIDTGSMALDFLYQDGEKFSATYRVSISNGFTNCLIDVDGDGLKETTKPTSTTITHDFSEPHSAKAYNHSVYKMYTAYEGVSVTDIEHFAGFDNYIGNANCRDYFPAEVDDFSVMNGFAGTMYAIRVYERVLTETEIQQNHTADLICYYDLDVDFFREVKKIVSDHSLIYALFDDMDFSLDKKEAQTIFESRLSGLCLENEGVSVRYDDSIGIRAKYGIDHDTLQILLDAGYTVEVGALLNVNTYTYPTLADYEHRIVVREDDGRTHDGFYLDAGKEVFAFTALFDELTRNEVFAPLFFTGYIKLTDAEGEVKELYTNSTLKNGEGVTLADAYSEAYIYEEVAKNIFVREALDGGYVQEHVYVDVNGDDDNTGAKDAPFKTLETAFAKIKALLSGANPVHVTLHLGRGVHRVTEAQVIDGADITQKYYKLTILGDDCKSKITSNVVLDNENFKKVDGEEYYVYQFPMDENGKYQDFKFFYVDGRIAIPAHHGDTHISGGTQHAFCNNPIFDKEDPDYRKLYVHRDLLEGITPEDMQDLEIHAQVQWEFKIMHIDRIDTNDCCENNCCIAVYLDEEEMANYNGNPFLNTYWAGRSYWLENTLGFVDKPDEYYYDSKTGQLFYFPRNRLNMETATFEIPTSEQLLMFYDIENLTVSGVTFTGTDHHTTLDRGAMMTQQGGGLGTIKYFGDRAALYISKGENIVIKDNHFDQLGGDALSTAKGLYKANIESNRFGFVKAMPIRVLDTQHYMQIHNNYIHDAAYFIRSCPAILIQFGEYMNITNNTIHDCAYTAISVGWRWNVATWEFGDVLNLYQVNIANNYIYNYMTDMGDGAAIYTLGGNVETSYHDYFNFMTDNVVVGIYSGNERDSLMPYYHDGASSNWLTSGNILFLSKYRYGGTPYYIQHVPGQEVFNVRLEENFTVYAPMREEWNELDEKQKLLMRIYYVNWAGNSTINPHRFITEENTYAIDNHEELKNYPRAVTTMANAGSTFDPFDYAFWAEEYYWLDQDFGS